eukprot:scaffold144499_cov40-Tisochrysis_lutea.AAC.4
MTRTSRINLPTCTSAWGDIPPCNARTPGADCSWKRVQSPCRKSVDFWKASISMRHRSYLARPIQNTNGTT